MRPVSHLDSYRTAGHVEAPAPPLPVLPQPWDARLADPDGFHLDLIHRWMQSPHVAAFWRQAWPRDRWELELRDHLAGNDIRPVLVALEGRPVIYLEVYRAARDRVAKCYHARPHDIGLHIAVGELAMTDRGLVRTLLPVLTRALFDADPQCTRVILEPDVRNTRAIKSFQAGGFQLADEILLPDKVAALMVCPR
ncbi:GNAT family N-acetyltransferase [Lentzea tibetensis]|uniref:GNAT family N-acetyltransferase n=1 Tax=Lentzea tibetensis TaxID=2591470 RepID=UPI001F3F472B|nr:GNAT family N-acetyltransferase [Lentzea tibetensis]